MVMRLANKIDREYRIRHQVTATGKSMYQAQYLGWHDKWKPVCSSEYFVVHESFAAALEDILYDIGVIETTYTKIDNEFIQRIIDERRKNEQN